MKGIGYIRVSMVGGREDLITTDLQEESIKRVCAQHGIELVDLVVELDKSARKGKKRPLWDKAVQRVLDGEATAFVCWNFSRFSRSLIDAERTIERIEQAGGKVFTEEGTTNKLERRFRLIMAEDESDRIAAGWEAIHARKIADGIHFASRVPAGYTRERDAKGKLGKLVRDPEMAPVITELFKRRAKGESWASLARYFIQQGGSPKTNPQAIRWMIQNRAYLGEARYGKKNPVVKRKAHDALVDQKLFDEANAVRGRQSRGDGSLTSTMLLNGVPKCAACGYVMSVVGSRYKNKTTGELERRAGYGCRTPICDHRAYIRAADLDDYVISRVFEIIRFVGTTQHVARNNMSERVKAEQALQIADYDRKRWIENREARRSITDDEYNEELAALTEAVAEAKAALMLARPEPPQIANIEKVWDEWSHDARREWLRKVIASVTVRSAERKHNVPVQDRVVLEVTFDHPTLSFDEAEPQTPIQALWKRRGRGPKSAKVKPKDSTRGD